MESCQQNFESFSSAKRNRTIALTCTGAEYKAVAMNTPRVGQMYSKVIFFQSVISGWFLWTIVPHFLSVWKLCDGEKKFRRKINRCLSHQLSSQFGIRFMMSL